MTVAGIAILFLWIYLFFGRGWFWAMRNAPDPGEPASLPSVTAVIPARDESATVGQAVASLANQRYGDGLRIVVVDDGSTDGTGAIARSAASSEILEVVDGAPLPEGWSGKLWAVHQGVVSTTSEYVLLTDADIVHPPGNVAGLAARAQRGGYDLVSYMAFLHCESLAERALVPAFVFFFFMLYPPSWIRNQRRKTAGAAGGCMLIRRDMLERIGGIATIRGELIDDCALARAIKRHGGHIWLGLSSDTRSIRTYQTFGEIGRIISRTAFTQLNYSTLLLVGTVLSLVVTYWLPPVLTFLGSPWGAAAWMLMAACYLPVLRFYRRSPLWAPALPLVAAFYAGCTVKSAIQYWRGVGGAWKGRAQAHHASPAAGKTKANGAA